MVGNPEKYKFRKIEKIYSSGRIESFKLSQKTKKPLLEINVIWQKLKSFLKKKKYDSILRRKVALRPRRFTRSEYTVKDGNGVKSGNTPNIPSDINCVRHPYQMAGNSRNNLYRSRPPRVESRLPRVEVGTSIGIEARRMRYIFKKLFTKTYIKKALALATILAVIITAYFQNAPQTQAGTEVQ